METGKVYFLAFFISTFHFVLFCICIPFSLIRSFVLAYLPSFLYDVFYSYSLLFIYSSALFPSILSSLTSYFPCVAFRLFSLYLTASIYDLPALFHSTPPLFSCNFLPSIPSWRSFVISSSVLFLPFILSFFFVIFSFLLLNGLTELQLLQHLLERVGFESYAEY
jgi:hypothetical protein